jgi:hypothetical protein
MSQRIIPYKDLAEVLNGLRNLRWRALQERLNPWAFRQALLIVEEIDKRGALERGVSLSDLTKFDATVREDANRWVREAIGL